MKFPTFEESIALASSTADIPKPRGLYEELFQSRPEHLYYDVVRTPEKYSPGVYPLLGTLVSGERGLGSLSQEERELLDRATAEYAQADPPPKAPTPAMKPVAAKTGPKARGWESGGRGDVETPRLGTAEMNAYWWL